MSYPSPPSPQDNLEVLSIATSLEYTGQVSLNPSLKVLSSEMDPVEIRLIR